jgi:ABC-type transporter Mla subunit MlaD
MVRKRNSSRNLSDLLRDEAESLEPSSADSPAEQTIDVSVEVVIPESKAIAPAAEPEPAAVETSRHSHPTKADLQEMVANLKAELESVRQQEQQLHHKIEQLERKRQAQQTQIQQLQQQLEDSTQLADHLAKVQQQLQTEQAQSSQVKTELEQAKQMILKLSEANSKPDAIAPAPAPTPTSAPSQRAPLQARALPSRPLPSRPAPSRSGAIQPISRPIAPNTIPKMSSETDTRLSDADIGWVD